jgi:hypothetical protein
MYRTVADTRLLLGLLYVLRRSDAGKLIVRRRRTPA